MQPDAAQCRNPKPFTPLHLPAGPSLPHSPPTSNSTTPTARSAPPPASCPPPSSSTCTSRWACWTGKWRCAVFGLCLHHLTTAAAGTQVPLPAGLTSNRSRASTTSAALGGAGGAPPAAPAAAAACCSHPAQPPRAGCHCEPGLLPARLHGRALSDRCAVAHRERGHHQGKPWAGAGWGGGWAWGGWLV